MPAWALACRPSLLYSGLKRDNPARRLITRPNLAIYMLFNIPAHTTRYIMYILVISKGYFDISGVISPTSDDT
jgi:hypothetical protein